VTRDDQILGREDVEALLDAHPDVERRPVKLWLTSGTRLSALVQAGTHARSRVLAQDIQRTLPLYVQSASFVEAEDRLRDSGVVLIAGEPGIGKTRLARMLVATAGRPGVRGVPAARPRAEPVLVVLGCLLTAGPRQDIAQPCLAVRAPEQRLSQVGTRASPDTDDDRATMDAMFSRFGD
jgi:hypothetical protein